MRIKPAVSLTPCCRPARHHARAGAVFDFALYFFHNAKQLLANGNGPYFYL